MAKRPDGVHGVLVAIRRGELENSKVHTKMEDGRLRMAENFGRRVPSSILNPLSSLFIEAIIRFRGGNPQ
jgi:hypothetical protein